MAKEFTYCEDTFSDLYKDANGFRPRSHEFYWDETTPERKQEIWDATLEDLDDECKRIEEMHKEAAVAFEALIEQTIAYGAIDKVNALKWLRQAEDDCYYEFDDGYFEYTHRLPYGYLKENGYVS
jgi:hypothetical protein